jgi:hypothetical protein
MSKLDRLIKIGKSIWPAPGDQEEIAKTIQALEVRYGLSEKIAREPGVVEIIEQMLNRLANSYGTIANLPKKRILDIACGSNSSGLPASPAINTLFGGTLFKPANKGYTDLFEPWFCRMLVEFGATPVGIDRGDLEGEIFEHYKIDLGLPGALNFLPDHSFDGIQDSRLFGSPEFTSEFPRQSERLQVAREILSQEERLLKLGGTLIHSDAADLFM